MGLKKGDPVVIRHPEYDGRTGIIAHVSDVAVDVTIEPFGFTTAFTRECVEPLHDIPADAEGAGASGAVDIKQQLRDKIRELEEEHGLMEQTRNLLQRKMNDSATLIRTLRLELQALRRTEDRQQLAAEAQAKAAAIREARGE